MVHPLWSTIGVQNPYAPVLLSDKIASAYSDPLVWDVEDRSAVSLQGYAGGTMGTAMGLGRRLDQLCSPAGVTVGISQVSVTGTLLGGATPHWDPNGTLPTGTNLFHVWINQALAAQTAMSGTVVGAVWIQGEADAGNLAAAQAYGTNLAAWLAALRTTFPGIYVVLNRLNIHDFPGLANVDLVRQGELALAANDPRVRVISCDDIPLPNGAHYDAQGYWELGVRCAEAAAALRLGGTVSGQDSLWRTYTGTEVGGLTGQRNL